MCISALEKGEDPSQKLLQKATGTFIFLLQVTVFRGGYHAIRGLFRLCNENFGPKLIAANRQFVIMYLKGLQKEVYNISKFTFHM